LRVFGVHHRNAQLLYGVVKDLVSPQGKVSLDMHTNSLVVLDYPENLTRIEKVIATLDVREKNVEIKVTVTESTSNFFDSIGLYGGQVVIPAAKFSAVLAALQTDKASKIRSEMTIKTLSGYPAALAVSRDEVFGQTVTHYMNRRDNLVVISDLRQEMGNFLEVVPTVNNDGTITVIVRTAVSKMEGDSPHESALLTQVTVANGDTIGLGGMERQASPAYRRKTTVFGIPISQGTVNQSKKVAVFLTTTIVE